MPMFTQAEMKHHVANSGKKLANKDDHTVTTNLRKAKRFLDDEYLENIECADDKNYFYFKANCCHSFKKNEAPHRLKLALCIVSGQIMKAECSCKAGESSFCNHLLALMFKVVKLSLNECENTTDLVQEDDQQPSCSKTSLLQKWHKKGGGSNIAPEPVLEVVVKKTKMDDEVSKSCVKPLLYEARKVRQHSAEEENALKANFANLNSNVGFSHMFNGVVQSDMKETMYGQFRVGTTLAHQVSFTESNFKAVADIDSVPRALLPSDNYQYPCFPHCSTSAQMATPTNLLHNEQEFLKKLQLSDNDIIQLEKATREQASSTKWAEERKFRFTASKFYAATHRVRNHDTFADNLINPKGVKARSLEHGRKYEPIALIAYEKFMHNRNTSVQVLKCGLVVDKGFPILGATPDARVIDPSCIHPYGIAEVKCPVTKFNVTPLDACTDPNFYMEKCGENSCRLKKSHDYYYQVQGQLGITGAAWCDFIVYTKVGLYVQRIIPDVPFWEEIRAKLQAYYFDHFIKYASSTPSTSTAL